MPQQYSRRDVMQGSEQPGTWETTTALLACRIDEVHVWRARLDPPLGQLRHIQHWLDGHEQRRSARFRFPHDRRRYAAAHLALRGVLAHYAGAQPDKLQFTVTPYGKPALADGHGSISFNLAHSHECAVIAISRNREVGIDVERVCPARMDEPLLRSLCSTRERAEWIALGRDARRDGFFRWWTRKEAYAKARGLGLALALDSFSVSLAPDAPAHVVHHGAAQADAEPWLIRDLSLEPDYVGAVAAVGDRWRLQRYTWTWPAL